MSKIKSKKKIQKRSVVEVAQELFELMMKEEGYEVVGAHIEFSVSPKKGKTSDVFGVSSYLLRKNKWTQETTADDYIEIIKNRFDRHFEDMQSFKKDYYKINDNKVFRGRIRE